MTYGRAHVPQSVNRASRGRGWGRAPPKTEAMTGSPRDPSPGAAGAAEPGQLSLMRGRASGALEAQKWSVKPNGAASRPL
jgi:hypothetical protein